MTSPAEKPVDFDHLDRYTGGDPAVTQEILRLFERQCQEMLGTLEMLAAQAPGAGRARWLEVTHTLKGAARGIGAFELAEAAADAERAPPAEGRRTIEALQRLKGQSEAVHLFIEDFLRQSR